MIQFVAIVVLMTILDSVQATPSVRRLSRYSRYWDQATAVDDWIDSLSDEKLSYFQDMIEKGYADALIDTFAAQHDEYGDYYGDFYVDNPTPGEAGGGSTLKHESSPAKAAKPAAKPAAPSHGPIGDQVNIKGADPSASAPEKHHPDDAAPPHKARMGYHDYYSNPKPSSVRKGVRNRRTFRY